MPDTIDNGFRLGECYEDLYKSFSEIRQEHGLLKNLELPMLYFTLTVEYALRRFGKDVDHITRAHWKEAIEKSGYLEAEIYQIKQ